MPAIKVRLNCPCTGQLLSSQENWSCHSDAKEISNHQLNPTREGGTEKGRKGKEYPKTLPQLSTAGPCTSAKGSAAREWGQGCVLSSSGGWAGEGEPINHLLQSQVSAAGLTREPGSNKTLPVGK